MPSKCWCKSCDNEMSRMYLRTRNMFVRYWRKKRNFTSIGWYCEKCRIFQLDQNDMIEKILSGEYQ